MLIYLYTGFLRTLAISGKIQTWSFPSLSSLWRFIHGACSSTSFCQGWVSPCFAITWHLFIQASVDDHELRPPPPGSCEQCCCARLVIVYMRTCVCISSGCVSSFLSTCSAGRDFYRLRPRSLWTFREQILSPDMAGKLKLLPLEGPLHSWEHAYPLEGWRFNVGNKGIKYAGTTSSLKLPTASQEGPNSSLVVFTYLFSYLFETWSPATHAGHKSLWSFELLKLLLLKCVCVMARVWRSEVNILECVLSFHCRFQGSNWGHQAVLEALLPAEPSNWCCVALNFWPFCFHLWSVCVCVPLCQVYLGLGMEPRTS